MARVRASGPRIFGSTISRIAIALMAVQFVSVSATLLLANRATERAMTAGSRELVNELRLDLSDTFAQGGRRALLERIGQRLDALDRHDIVIGLRDAKGNMLGGNLAQWPAGAERETTWQWVELGGSGRAAGIEVHRLADGSLLIAGDAMEDEKRALDLNRQTMVIMFALGLALAALSSWLLARYIGRKIDGISEASTRFAGGELEARVPLDESGDAFDRLARKTNDMMSRLESLIRELRLITDSLAHDLRSPVARVRARLEQAHSASQDGSTRDQLAASLEECDRLDHMLAQSLQISRAEAGLGREQFQSFSLADMLDNLAELYGPLAEEEGFTVKRTGATDIIIHAHRQLLGQALGNLVDNAIRHARGSDSIELGFDCEGERLLIFVADNGPGISEGERADALKRFGRLDAARRTAGAGLGLALVSTVAHLHGGTFELRDNAPGLSAVLVLPPETIESR